MNPTIVPAVITQDRELLWRLPNVRMGDHLANPRSRIGALLFYPPEMREKPSYTHERFLLDADTAWHVERLAPAIRSPRWTTGAVPTHHRPDRPSCTPRTVTRSWSAGTSAVPYGSSSTG